MKSWIVKTLGIINILASINMLWFYIDLISYTQPFDFPIFFLVGAILVSICSVFTLKRNLWLSAVFGLVLYGLSWYLFIIAKITLSM